MADGNVAVNEKIKMHGYIKKWHDCIEGSLNHPLQIIQTNETLHITGLVRRNIRVLTHHIYSHLTWLKLCDSTYCIALKGIAKKTKKQHKILTCDHHIR